VLQHHTLIKAEIATTKKTVTAGRSLAPPPKRSGFQGFKHGFSVHWHMANALASHLI